MDPLMLTSVVLLDRDGAFEPARDARRRRRARRTNAVRLALARWLRRAAARIEPAPAADCAPVAAA